MEKKPFVTLEQVKEMAASYPTPFHLYDEKGIRENAKKLKAAFAWNPNFHEYFAVKATPNPYIMDILKSEGIGADCSSYTELLMSDAVGLKGHDIMFSSNVTPAEDFKKAAELGAIINFDDVSLIDFYEEIGAPFLETMCCRYNPGGNFTLHNEIMDTPKDAKYGMTKEQMKEAFTKLKAHGVKHFGIHAFLASFHLYDEKGIRENAKKLKAAFAWNPNFHEYFAVKATPNPYIMDILKSEGIGADCSSYTELLMSDAVGLKGHDIMFSSNVTPAEDFKKAAELGAIINFDDVSLIDFYEEIGAPFLETMCCRYNPGGNFTLHNEIMDTPKDAKYGMTKEQMKEAFTKLKAHGVKHFGIHAFLASNTVALGYYPKLARILFELAVELSKEVGVHIAFVNLSGGVGIAYRPDQEPNDIMAIGAAVKEAYDEVLVPAGMDDVAIFTELGRFMLAPYGCLVAKVLHEKHIWKDYVGLDACAANLMRPAMYGAYHHITVLGKENEPCDHMYDVTGGLCENNDKFAIDRMLPKIDIGDYVVIHDTGAHGFSMGYNYNGKLRSAELLLKEDGTVKQIRRAETPQDYFATLDYPGLKDEK